jgi:hypothetical protein
MFLATFWAIYFTNSSGHPVCDALENEVSMYVGTGSAKEYLT